VNHCSLKFSIFYVGTDPNHNPIQKTSRPVTATLRQPDTTGLQPESKSPAKILEWQRRYASYCDLARHANDDVVERERYWQQAEHFIRMINGSAD
jgi:hypothetical protein